LTKIFIFGDVASFVTQGVGAIIISNQTADDMTRSANIITIGLAVQILFFLWFIVTSRVFHWRTNLQPTDRSRNPGVPWKQYLITLYLASAMILIRCIYRFIEYRTQQSKDVEYLLSHEWCAYIFDATLMLIVMLLFFIRHPSEINALRYPRGGIVMRYVSRKPVEPVNDHWRILPNPVMSEKGRL
jgi:tellurite resistance protein TehA-like permease